MAARTPRRLAHAACLLCAVSLAACIQNDGSRNPLKSLTNVSEAQERETGASADSQIQAQLPLIDDPMVLGFVNDLGQAMVRRIEPQPFIYRFRVVVDSQLNAFALPGGYIYFHSGTLLSASSLDELAGVMAHEIAHVKGRHYARMVEQARVPNLLTTIAGLAATIATGEVAPLLVSQGVNVALQLRFTREYEAEADELGGAFMARAGYDPLGMARFFERIVAAEKAAEIGRIQIPPYLYSHPDVGSRIDAVVQRAERITVTGTADPALEASFREAQLRLAILLQTGQTTLRRHLPPPDRAVTDPLLARATERVRSDDRAGALELLEEAERLEPTDPRVPFRRGELLEEARRTRDAIAAWRRALLLDPGVALTHFRIGMAYRSLGDRVNATFYLEQALRRFEPGGALQRRAAQELERLTFPVVTEAGLADGRRSEGADTVAGHSREEFRVGEPEAVWWGRIGDRWMGRRGDLRVRWTAPSGEVVQEEEVERTRRPFATATLALPTAGGQAGIWRVEVLLEDELVDRRTFRLVEGTAGR